MKGQKGTYPRGTHHLPPTFCCVLQQVLHRKKQRDHPSACGAFNQKKIRVPWDSSLNPLASCAVLNDVALLQHPLGVLALEGPGVSGEVARDGGVAVVDLGRRVHRRDVRRAAPSCEKQARRLLQMRLRLNWPQQFASLANERMWIIFFCARSKFSLQQTDLVSTGVPVSLVTETARKRSALHVEPYLHS